MARQRPPGLRTVLACALVLVPSWAVGQPPQPTGPEPANAAPTKPAALTAETAPVVIHEMTRRIRLETDGRFTETTSARVTIRERSALSEWGQLSFVYLSEFDTIALKRLVVEKPGGGRVEADLSRLEEGPTPESGSFDAPAYNDSRVKQITVPSLAVGDTVHYEAVLTRHTPFLRGHYWDAHTFRRGAIVEREVLEIEHPERLPLAVKLRAGFAPVVSDLRDGGLRRRAWTTQVRALSERGKGELVDRLANMLRGRGEAPDIQLSTFESWNDVAAWYASLSRLPEQPTELVRARARQIGELDAGARLRALHKAVAQDVRYVSLAFGDGRYRPRPADLTLSSTYGDCKDKHALLAALGSELGFEVRPALINSDRELDVDFPSPGQFDHVISRVARSDGSHVWVDATVDVARPGTLLRRLRDKQALLVLADGTGEIVRTAAEGDREFVKVDISGEYAADGAYRVVVRREFGGEVETTMRAALKTLPQHEWADLAIGLAKEDGLGDKVTVKAVTMGEPMDLSRPLWVQYEIEHKYTSPIRRERWTYWLPTPQVMQLPAHDGETAMPLGELSTIELTARVVLPGSLAITPPVGVSLDHESGRYESTYGAEGGVLTVRRRLETRVERVEKDRIPALLAFERSVKADRNQRFTVDAAAGAALAALEASDHVAAGERALGRGDMAQAVTSLRAAVAQTPEHPRAWNSLGRALHALGRFDEAIEAYDRQIALDRYHEHAYRNRGLVQWQAGRLKDAEASLREQIAVTPLNAGALTSLGSLLVESKRETEAVEPLTKAVSLADKDPLAHVTLGRALAATGRRVEALASFERIAGMSPNPQTWNNAAWHMAESGLALDKALEFAQFAVAAASAASLTSSLDKPPVPQLFATMALAAYWDTLGWVLFKQGRDEDALKYVRASWLVSQAAKVGEHLGRIYERLGRPREAFVVYRTAMGMPRPPDFVGTRAGELAKALTPPPQTADSRTLDLELRTIPLRGITPVAPLVEVMLVSDSRGVITAVRPASAGVEDAAVRALIGVKLPVEPPDAVPFRLVARGALMCTDGRPPCSLVLYRPDEALLRVASEPGSRQP